MSIKNSAGVQFNAATDLIIEADPDGTVTSCRNRANDTEYVGGSGGGGNVTIKLTNPVGASSFTACEIKAVDEYGTPSEVIGNITSATGSITLDCPAMIFVICYGPVVSVPRSLNNYTCSGSVGINRTTSSGIYIAVAGDGSVTISGIEWTD